MKKLKVVEVLQCNGVNSKVIIIIIIHTFRFVTLKHACSLTFILDS